MYLHTHTHTSVFPRMLLLLPRAWQEPRDPSDPHGREGKHLIGGAQPQSEGTSGVFLISVAQSVHTWSRASVCVLLLHSSTSGHPDAPAQSQSCPRSVTVDPVYSRHYGKCLRGKKKMSHESACHRDKTDSRPRLTIKLMNHFCLSVYFSLLIDKLLRQRGSDVTMTSQGPAMWRVVVFMVKEDAAGHSPV